MNTIRGRSKGFAKIATGRSRPNSGEDDEHETDVANSTAASEETPLNKQNMYSKEYLKTLSSFGVLFASALTGAFIIAYIHRFSVSQDQPLPDLIFNMVPRQKWAWQAADIVVMIVPGIGYLVLLFHKHWTIVFRRMCILAAVLYLIRAAFLLCTYLPPPFDDFKEKCLPANFTDNTAELFVEAFTLLFKGGFSASDNKIMCGDTIYSGHSLVFTVVCLMLWYNCPKPLFPLVPVLVSCLSAFGIVAVIISRQHYTIDVVVAIFVTVSIFYGYHVWARQPRTKICFSWSPFRCRPVYACFLVFEGNVPCGRLPSELAWPFPCPAYAVSLFDKVNDWSRGKDEPARARQTVLDV